MAGSSVINVRTIKPAKIRSQAMIDAIEAIADDVLNRMVDDFRATTETWEHEVKFEYALSMKPSVLISVHTLDEIFEYVNEGTKPHTIRPKGKGYPLRFQWGGKGSYTPKTKPKVIGSRPGGPSGPEVRMAVVHHPGTKAREFDKVIQKKWTKPFKAAMQKALDDAARASGHGIP